MSITAASDWQFGPGVVYHCGTEYTTKRRNIELLRLLVEHGGIVEWHDMAAAFGDEYITSNAINDISNLRKWLRATFRTTGDPIQSFRGYTAWRFRPDVFLSDSANVSSVGQE